MCNLEHPCFDSRKDVGPIEALEGRDGTILVRRDLRHGGIYIGDDENTQGVFDRRVQKLGLEIDKDC